MTAETLEAIFVQRHNLADYLVDLIRESALTANKHFRLLLGMRGIGKTHMITLMYHRVSNMEDLQDKLVIAWLREEEWGVTSFLDLLLRIFRALQKEYPAEYNAKLNQQVEALYQLSQQEAEHTAAALLREFVGKRTLLLLMENLDDVFNGLGDIGQKQLRAYIQNYSFLTILATAQSLFDGIIRKDDPFYNFFYPHHLEELTLDEAVDLLRHIAELEGDRELEDFIKTATGRDRVRAIHHLSGGNPRVYVIFSQFLTRKLLDELVEPFMRMLDDLTPYYQARMSWLSQQQRKIIEFLADRRRAVSVKEIAQRCFMTHQTASSQLKDLREKGYVNSEFIGRESFYELHEPLMRFCLEVKKQRDEPIRLFIDFLRIWYTRTELQQRLGHDIDEIKNNGWFDDLAQQFNDARIDDFPYERNHSRYQQRLEPLPPDAVVEREYVLYALQAMEDDDEDPRVAAYWQEYENCFEKKDYANALRYAEKLVLIRGQAEDWLEQGRCLNGLKRYEEALASFDKAISLDFNFAKAWGRRGESLNNLQYYENALVSLDKAISLDPYFARAWANRGDVLDNLQCYEYALVSLDKAIGLDPNYVWAWVRRGLILNNLKRYEDALVSYDKAISLDPNDIWAWRNRGVLLEKFQRYQEALAAYDKAILLDPKSAWTWSKRGDVLDKLQRYEEALASYDKAISLNPNYTWAWANRGDMLDKLQRYEEALASFDKVISLNPNYDWAWGERGDMLDKLQRYEEALASYDKAISLNPDYAWAWANRGWSLKKLQRYEEALASYDKAISLNPNYDWAWCQRGDVLDKLQHYEEALASYDKAISLDPNYDWIWANRGDMLDKLQRYEEALASFDKAISLDPNYIWAWGQRGDVLDKLQRYEEALASYDKAISLDPNYKWDWVKRGDLLGYLKRYEEALVSYDKAISLDSNFAWALSKRGWVLFHLKRYKDALASLDKAIELNLNSTWAWFRKSVVLYYLKRHEEALASVDKAIELDPNYDLAWDVRGRVLINLERYDEALIFCTQAIALGELSFYVFFNRALSLLGLNHWDEGITVLDDALNRFAEVAEPDAEDAELIICILFNSTNDAALWKTRITTLVELYNKHQVAPALAQGLVQEKTISALMSEMVSDKAAQTWLEVWQVVVGNRPEFQIPLRLLNAAVRYRETKGDRRVLLELPIEERKLLQEVLGIS
ncbi:tetratricopeptide repeat protein [Brasilonema sp. CT11]|nr:tetratricopeptide repeat protein [Brasilonema sp. CT11]